jgi:hypothetical protein
MYTETIPAATLAALRAELSIPDALGIRFEWEHDDDVSPEDSFCDDEAVKWVREQMEHNDAAWFRAQVTVTDGDAEGFDYLGGCSYVSFAEFLTHERGGYFREMVANAFDEYKEDAERLAAKYAH